ncbi:MAG: hypothetical protein ACOYM3_23815, partial [Terrimicrobiaceae bacterium]
SSLTVDRTLWKTGLAARLGQRYTSNNFGAPRPDLGSTDSKIAKQISSSVPFQRPHSSSG